MQNSRPRPFRDSLAELKNTRTLATCAMLLAVQILLGFIGTISIGTTLRIGFGFLAVATAAYLFGPVPAMVNAALCDLILYVLKPTGAFHPGFTLSAALGGLIYGLFFYGKRVTVRRATLAKLVVDIACNVILNTLWLQQMYDKAFMVLLVPRVIKNMLQLVPDVILLSLLFPSLSRVFKSLGKPMPEANARTAVRGQRPLIALAAVLWMVVAVWLNNTSMLVNVNDAEYKLLAHRGLAQTFDISKVESDTNTAEVIYPPEHEYLENTIASMRRAFELGADCVELDLHRTKDDQLAVFHDYLVDYRTEASGLVLGFTMDELRQLDVGYGYTADGGLTHPFRGEGIGLMPEFEDVLAAFPGEELLIHLKDGGTEVAELTWQAIMGLEPERLAQLSFYGSDDSMAYLMDQSDELRVMSMATLKDALLKYELLGWTGYVPASMKHAQLHIPESYARFLWGWPARFMQRMGDVDTRVVLVAGDGGWSEGFDDAAAMGRVPDNYTGYVWTNRIDRVGGGK